MVDLDRIELEILDVILRRCWRIVERPQLLQPQPCATPRIVSTSIFSSTIIGCRLAGRMTETRSVSLSVSA